MDCDKPAAAIAIPSSPAPAPLPLPPLANPGGRPKRIHRLPPRFVQDMTPEPPAPIAAEPGVIRRVILHVRDTIWTGANKFGLVREYPHRPSVDPDHFVPPADLLQAPTQPSTPASELEASRPRFWPFKSMAVYLLMDWMHTGSSRKSVGEVDRLAKVLTHPEFTTEDMSGFSARKQNALFDASDTKDPESSEDQSVPGDGWRQSTVEISIPTGEKDPTGNGLPFTVHGLHHRPLLGVMKAAVADVSSRWFHYFPFRRFWDSPSGERVRVYDEAYTSDVWLKAHDDLQKQPNEPGCELEKVILGLMFWSDSTHLTSFGAAKVWPVYLYFGNLSKYMRSKPSCAAAHHVAYIPPVRSLCFSRVVHGTHTSLSFLIISETRFLQAATSRKFSRTVGVRSSRRYGESFLTLISCTPTNMALRRSVPMASGDAFILVYSATLLTILRSEQLSHSIRW